MHVLFRFSVLVLCFAATLSMDEDKLECGLRHCGVELLHFEKFSLSHILRKMELASFCVKNCTPAIVHEFFQSIIFGITQRIPGHCTGEACVDKNRFVALAKCMEDEAFPLIMCSKTLIDLTHIGLVAAPEEGKRNETCRIVTETVQCFEETLQNCGETPFQLVKEIVGKFVTLSINSYCHPSYNKEGWFMKLTTGLTRDPSLPTTSPVTEVPEHLHPQFVKGYRHGSAGFAQMSYICLVFSVTISIILSLHHSP